MTLAKSGTRKKVAEYAIRNGKRYRLLILASMLRNFWPNDFPRFIVMDISS
jgi:hypothetical protein